MKTINADKASFKEAKSKKWLFRCVLSKALKRTAFAKTAVRCVSDPRSATFDLKTQNKVIFGERLGMALKHFCSTFFTSEKSGNDLDENQFCRLNHLGSQEKKQCRI